MIKAVIFDIYGTLLRITAGELNDVLKNKNKQLAALKKAGRKHGLFFSEDLVLKMMFAEIKKEHAKKKKLGILYPEICIEKIWKKVFDKIIIGKKVDIKKFSLDYYTSCSKTSLYSETKELLLWLKKHGIYAGIISNAQFYGEIDFVHLLGINKIDKLFNKNLIFYSYKLGCSKPDQKSFNLLKKEVKKLRIKEDEVLFVGNDMYKDVNAAFKAGLKTCLTINKDTRYRKNMNILKPHHKIKSLHDIKKIIINSV